jgi:hypothetical protein
MKLPKRRNLQEIVLVARSKFAGIELAYSYALSQLIAAATGIDEKSILCSVELDEVNPVYGLDADSNSVMLRYNGRVLVPEDKLSAQGAARIEELVKKTIEEAFTNENVEFKLEISDNIFKVTFFYSSIELPPVVKKEDQLPSQESPDETDKQSTEMPETAPAEDESK